MKTPYKSIYLIALLPLFFIGIGAAYGASKFPEKPITLVLHTGPGAGPDILARNIQAAFDKHKLLPQPFVVESKPGGSGVVSMAYVAGKKKDPYTLLVATTVIQWTPLQTNTQITYKDFTPVCGLDSDGHMLLTGINSKFKSLKDVVDAAKANPGSIMMGGTLGVGTGSVNTRRFERAAGIKLKYVPFNDGAQVVVALLGGHIDLTNSNPGDAIELIKGNKVRVLGVIKEKRLDFPGMRDYPTLKEQGVNAVGFTMYRGIVAPKDIPQDALKILQEAFFKYSRTEERRKYEQDNMIGAEFLDSAGYGKLMDETNEIMAAELTAAGFVLKKK